ncbi:MAG: hypothetical protein IJT94_03870, partial [Oscillibacter sp.]|nr:hypothetical protein [Oscillibacter sp.]
MQQTLSPLRAMRRWTGYHEDSPGYKLFQSLADGQRDSMDYQMRAWNSFQEILQDRDFARWFSGKHAEEITVSGWGPDSLVDVKIVPAMRVELYLHKLNGKQNLAHIEEGGVTVPDMRLYKKGDLEAAFNKGTTVRFNEAMIDGITAHMTQQEKRFAELCFQYFNGMAPNEVNRVFELLKGYSVYLDRNHFPIITNRKYLKAAEFDSIKFDGSMEGRGEFKERQTGAHNPILLMGADYVVSRSIRRDAQFVGLAIPIRNFNKVWGVTQASFDEQGQRNGVISSVQDALVHQWGQAAYNYVEDLMADLQGTRQRKRTLWSTVNSLYARATLTWNHAVALKQFASFPTAGAVVGRQALTKALFTNPEHLKLDRDLIARYTPLLWYRSIGFRETELGDLTANRDVLDQIIRDRKTANWVQAVDIFTTERLWLAAEYYVRDNLGEFNLHREDVAHADGNNRADAYYNAVAQVYNRVIEETQPNYTTMQRGANLRSDNEMLRSLLMFKTQPFQNLNILYDTIENYRAKSNPENGFTQAERKRAGQDLSRAVFSQLAANALFVVIGALANDFPKWKKDKYTDEEGNITPLSVAMALGKDMMGSAAGMVPAGTEVWDFFRAAVLHDRYYGIEAANISFVSDLASRFLSYASFVEKGLEVREDGTRTGYNPRLMVQESWRLFETVAKAFGLPAQNVANIFLGTARAAMLLSRGGITGEYRMLTWTGNPVSSGAYDLLYQALAREDMDAFNYIASDLQKHYRTSGGSPITGKSIRDKMLAKYRDEMKKSGGTKLSRKALDYIGAVETYQVEDEPEEDKFTEASMNDAQHRKFMQEYADLYRTMADAIDSSNAFPLMDNEQRNSAKKSASQLATQVSLANNSGGQRELDTRWMLWATGGAAYNVTEDMAILFKT